MLIVILMIIGAFVLPFILHFHFAMDVGDHILCGFCGWALGLLIGLIATGIGSDAIKSNDYTQYVETSQRITQELVPIDFDGNYIKLTQNDGSMVVYYSTQNNRNEMPKLEKAYYGGVKIEPTDTDTPYLVKVHMNVANPVQRFLFWTGYDSYTFYLPEEYINFFGN